MPVDKWINQELYLSTMSVSRICPFSSLVLPRSLAGFALSFGCGEHYWLFLKSRI
jgi:hypothetical protein